MDQGGFPNVYLLEGVDVFEVNYPVAFELPFRKGEYFRAIVEHVYVDEQKNKYVYFSCDYFEEDDPYRQEFAKCILDYRKLTYYQGDPFKPLPRL